MKMTDEQDADYYNIYGYSRGRSTMDIKEVEVDAADTILGILTGKTAPVIEEISNNCRARAIEELITQLQELRELMESHLAEFDKRINRLKEEAKALRGE